MNSLLKHLLSYFLFAGTSFFAAGAVIDAGAMDGADDTGGSDDAGGGDGAGGGEGDEAGAAEGAGDSALAGPGTDAEKAGDSRTLPKNIQAALKTLKEAHPELAKDIEELRKGYFGHRQHSEFFKSPTEARQAKATLDLVGGAEGISTLQSQVAAVEAVDAGIESGDPQVIEDIASDFPDGFKKLAAPFLDKLQTLDPQAFVKTIQPHAFASMETAGLGPVLGAIGEAIAANDLPKAKDLLGKTAAWYEGQKQQAGTRQKTDDPERLKFENERKQFNETKEKTFREDIGRQTLSNQSSEINKALVPYLKSKALGAEAKADLLDGVNREINRLLKADGTYQSQVKALLTSKTRDSGKIVQYINAAVAEAAPKAVKALWARRYGAMPAAKPNPNPGAKPNAVANPAQSGPLKIAAKPNRADVDWAKTKDILYITNKAYMKNGPYKGKLVTW